MPLFQAGGCYEPLFGTRHENVLGLVVALAQNAPYITISRLIGPRIMGQQITSLQILYARHRILIAHGIL